MPRFYRSSLVSWLLFFSSSLSPLLSGQGETSLWPDKQELQSRLWQHRRIVYLYPDQGKTAALYEQRLGQMRRGRYIRTTAIPVSAADSLPANTPITLVGRPGNNPLLQRLLPALPFDMNRDSFRINGHTYDNRGDRLLLRMPNPLRPGQWLQIITGNSDQAILAEFQPGRRSPELIADYTIRRGQELLAYGFLSQPRPSAPWVISRNREINLLHSLRRVSADSIFIVDYIGRSPDREKIRAFLARQKQLVEEQCAILQIDAEQRRRFLPIRLKLYESSESKTIATRNSRLSHWQTGSSVVHIVFSENAVGADYTAIAEYITWHFAGEVPNPLLLRGAGVLFSDAWGGKGYPVWAGMFFHNAIFPPFELIFAPAERRISRYVSEVQAATLLQLVLFHYSPQELKKFLRQTPARLDAATFPRYFSPKLIQQWRTWSRAMLPRPQTGRAPTVWQFARGFCFAHEGYAVYNGYMGSTAEAALQRLQELNVNAISITPFGFLREKNRPVPIGLSTGAGSENDESLIVAIARARRKNMRIMMKPHLWVSHSSWPGDIAMNNAQDWQRFFVYYSDWIMHYAILAEMLQTESFSIGVELARTTIGHEQEWRELIGRIRKIYHGKLLYSANWGEEFENITFWDALDAISVNSYYPLSDNPNASDAELLAGARKVAERIGAVSKKFQKPVLLTETGYASRPAPWIEPHRDGRGQPADEQAQMRAYDAFFRAFYRRPWLAGIYLWKWPTVLESGGGSHSGFTPNGKLAENVVKKWYAKISGE